MRNHQSLYNKLIVIEKKNSESSSIFPRNIPPLENTLKDNFVVNPNNFPPAKWSVKSEQLV